MMTMEPPGTPAVMPRRVMHNFHHIINPDDIAPFIFNKGILAIDDFLNRVGTLA